MSLVPSGRRRTALVIPAAGAVLGLAVTAGAVVPGAQAGTASPRPTPVVHAASPLGASTHPERIVTTVDGDPATTRAVSWRTDPSVTTGEAQVAPTSAWTEFTDEVVSVSARTAPLDAGAAGTSHYHQVRFEDLQPGTEYVYRVGDVETDTWSSWAEFTTADAQAAPFRFLFLGDAQNDIEEHWTRVVDRAFRDAPDARLLVHPGDLIDYGDRDGEWAEWTGALGDEGRRVPTLAAAGNHEYFREDGSRALSEHWRLQFALPQNGPDGDADFAGTVYSTDYQGVRFIGLNSAYREAAPGDTAAQGEFLDAQAAWLEEQLEDNPNRWTVVFFHHPVYSTAVGRDNSALRERWCPLLEEYGVDLVLSGHDHTYGRGWTDTDRARDVLTGPVYVNSVSGPKMYEVSGDNWTSHGATAVRTAEHAQLYQVVDVDSRGLRVVTRDATGTFVDGFEVQRRGGDLKRVVELDAAAVD